MPPLEHAEHFMVEAMKQAGLDPAVIYAFEKTGLLVTEANEHLISDVDRAEWEAAVLEYRAKHGEEPRRTRTKEMSGSSRKPDTRRASIVHREAVEKLPSGFGG